MCVKRFSQESHATSPTGAQTLQKAAQSSSSQVRWLWLPSEKGKKHQDAAATGKECGKKERSTLLAYWEAKSRDNLLADAASSIHGERTQRKSSHSTKTHRIRKKQRLLEKVCSSGAYLWRNALRQNPRDDQLERDLDRCRAL